MIKLAPPPYQYSVEILDFKSGMVYKGVFRTMKDAEDYIERKRQEGVHWQPAISGQRGTQVYGEWQAPFNVDAYLNRVGEWWGKTQSSGND